MMSSNTEQLSFYQSAIVEYTPVDHSNPIHVRLLELIAAGQVPSAEATELMKQADFKPSQSPMNTPAWSSDLFLFSSVRGHVS